MTNPTDGRWTSLQLFSGQIPATALMSVVSPGNAASGINYGLQFQTLATNIASTILPNGATGSILFGQGPSSSPAFLPVSGDVLFTNNATVSTSTIAGHAVTFAKFQTVTGLSVVGVNGTATGNVGAITGTTDQVLRVDSNGTTLAFGAINLATTAAITGVIGVPNGGTGTSTLTQAGVVFGNGTSIVGITAAGGTALPLTATGGTAAPTFALLTVPGGGTGTTALTLNRIPIGNGSSPLTVSNVATTGWPLVGNGTSSPPAFAILGVPGGGIGTSSTTPFGVLFGGITATSQIQSIATTGATGLVLTSQGPNAVPIFSASGAGTVTQVLTAGLATGGPITTSGTITVAAAAQSDMTTATSTTLAVTPGRQQFHPSAAKAWVGFTGSNGSTIANYNVSSVTRISTGIYNVNFTVSFATATSYVASIASANAGAGYALGFSDSSVNSGGICRVAYQNSVGVAADPTNGWVVFFGTQ